MGLDSTVLSKLLKNLMGLLRFKILVKCMKLAQQGFGEKCTVKIKGKKQ